MAKENWIQGAIKRPGAFKAKAKAAGKSTSAYASQVLKPSSKATTRTKRQAALAKTLSKIRSGKAAFAVALVLFGAGSARAVSVNCPGWLIGPAAQAAAAVGPNSVSPRAVPALIVQAMSPTGTASVQIEQCCSPIDCTAAGTWAPVGAVMSLAVATPAQVASITNPACTYRANVTACSTCAVNVVAVCAGP